MKNLLPEQCRAARGMLGWTQERLAVLAGLSRSTVRDFECCRHQLHPATEARLVETLEAAGIRLVLDREEPGVTQRRKPAAVAHKRTMPCATARK